MRQVHIKINSDTRERLEADLELATPCQVKIDYGHPVTSDGRLCYGTYNTAGRLVTINLGVDWYSNNKLHVVKRELLVTTLHEFRHAHQHDNWNQAQLNVANMEADAEEWAQKNVGKYPDLFRIHSTSRSSLSRLSQAEARVR